MLYHIFDEAVGKEIIHVGDKEMTKVTGMKVVLKTRYLVTAFPTKGKYNMSGAPFDDLFSLSLRH